MVLQVRSATTSEDTKEELFIGRLYQPAQEFHVNKQLLRCNNERPTNQY